MSDLRIDMDNELGGALTEGAFRALQHGETCAFDLLGDDGDGDGQVHATRP